VVGVVFPAVLVFVLPAALVVVFVAVFFVFAAVLFFVFGTVAFFVRAAAVFLVLAEAVFVVFMECPSRCATLLTNLSARATSSHDGTPEARSPGMLEPRSLARFTRLG
jgi:hypothetical protein